MNDPVPTPEPSALAGAPPRAGEPAAPGTYDGRAKSFRERETERRSERRQLVGTMVVVVIIIAGVIAILTARPFFPSSGSSVPKPGPPITVTLGTPVLSTVNCSGGGTAYVEKMAWVGATAPVSTGDIATHVFEEFDGDFIPDLHAVANVTVSNLCAGSPPDPTMLLWYVVLTSPNGTTVLSYTVTAGWTAISSGSWNIPVQNGSAIYLVTGTSLAQRGYGFAVVGFSSGSTIRGSIPL